MSYLDVIESARTVREEDIESCLTTGDDDYPGTALEITDKEGNELFHVVLDSQGERQILFWPQGTPYRLPLDLVDKIVTVAKEKVVVS